jgi:glycosyl transferase family 25
MDDLPQVFVISLKSSTDRRARIQNELEALGFAFRFVDGIDLRNTDIRNHSDYDGERRRLYFGRDLEPGELGCLLSHREVYRIMVNENIPRALVLEDDARLEADLPRVLQSIINSKIEWDMIRFLDKKKVYRKKCRRIGMLDAKHELARLPTNSGGAYGYLLNHRAASRLLDMMRRNWLQNDVLHSRTWQTGLTAYIVRPSPVTHPNDEDTTIGTKRYDKAVRMSGLRRLVHPIMRFAMKNQDQMMKRANYLTSIPLDRRNREILAGLTK